MKGFRNLKGPFIIFQWKVYKTGNHLSMEGLRKGYHLSMNGLSKGIFSTKNGL